MDIEAIDVIDRKIIDQLRIDGRRSFGEIGRYVGLSEASVRSRYSRLADLGVVQVVGMSDSIKMGDVEAHLSLRIRGATVDAVARALVAFPEVRFVGSAIGAFDLIVDVRCDDLAHLSQFLTDTVRRIPGIEAVESSTVLEIIKDSYLWAGFRDPVDRPTRPHPASPPSES